MSKRIVASIVGLVAVFVSLIACVFAIEATRDVLKNPAVFSCFDVFGFLTMWSMALAGFWLGIRFLRFAWSGRSKPISGWLRSILLGVLFFFPGFIFSLPLTILWATYTWPGDGQSVFAAMQVSLYIGVAAAIVCCVVLLKKRNFRAYLSHSAW